MSSGDPRHLSGAAAASPDEELAALRLLFPLLGETGIIYKRLMVDTLFLVVNGAFVSLRERTERHRGREAYEGPI